MANHFSRYTQAFATKVSLVVQLQRFFSTNIFLILYFPKGFYMIKENNSTIKYLNDLKNLPALSNHVRPLNIQWWTDTGSAWIGK